MGFDTLAAKTVLDLKKDYPDIKLILVLPCLNQTRGWKDADVKARTDEYPGIETPKDLYRVLWHVWSKETCTARMREDWTEENATLGQCTITAFLAQDIFGGRVWGVPLEDGNFHCFNAVENRIFDLTSEQFGDRKLDYSLRYEQLRHDHFMKPGKRERYEALKEALKQELKP